MGSVKDLEILKEPTEKETGLGRFHFSDRYSVFDWGEMPDHIALKGASIALLSAYFFERLEREGIKTHYRGLVEEGVTKRLDELRSPSDIMEISLLRVLKPELKGQDYDYSFYKSQKGNFLIPLEIIYRNSLPEGSSVFKRLNSGQLSLEALGLESMPEPGQKLPNPIYDVSTKLEITDRYIDWDEAKEIASLTDEELKQIKNITALINQLITSEFERIGLDNEDGKIELGFDPDRRLIVVDVLGTLDECRFTYRGLQVSKEIARIYYRKTEWFNLVEEAKKRDRLNWKSLVKSPPPPLPPRLRELISFLYQRCTNDVTQREWFAGIPSLDEIMAEIEGFLR
ncbi:MAG: phosphoribosylaminoimidazolesuccinocarboxamide synthase [Nitrospirae bacterium]|nr:MAG: phosphoribosylaminoimidazolesuccinocarboxamide synthase [Nitrospirota bacterium]